jgi:hypothetical protein
LRLLCRIMDAMTMASLGDRLVTVHLKSPHLDASHDGGNIKTMKKYVMFTTVSGVVVPISNCGRRPEENKN